MNDKIKAGIVGLGYMGEIRQKICQLHPDIDFVSACDTNPRFSETLPKNVKFYNNYQDMIKQDIALVFVCTPNIYIPGVVIDSLNSGKHVFCEKPPGRTIEDIENIIEAEKNNLNLKLKFGFNHRYHPGIQEAKKIINSKKFGRILWLRGVYGKSGGVSFKDSWRNKKEMSGGGILLDQGIHMIDIFRFFCGDFTHTKAFMQNAYWGFDIEDNAMVILKNENNQIASLHSSSTLWKHTFRIEIGLEEGYFNVNGFLSKSGSYGRETLIIGKRQFENEAQAIGNPREEVIYFDKDDSWYLEVDDLVKCIKQNKKVNEANSTDALKAMKLVYQIYNENRNTESQTKKTNRRKQNVQY